MALSEYTGKIAELQALIDKKRRAITEVTASANQWLNQSKASCSGKIGKAKDNCRTDLEYKASMARTNFDEAARLQREIDVLVKQIDTYKASIESENKQAEQLAIKGVDVNSLAIKARGEANALEIAARATSEAQAKAIEKTAETEAANSSTQNTAVLAVVAVVVLLAVGFAIIKIRNKKRK